MISHFFVNAVGVILGMIAFTLKTSGIKFIMVRPISYVYECKHLFTRSICSSQEGEFITRISEVIVAVEHNYKDLKQYEIARTLHKN